MSDVTKELDKIIAVSERRLEVLVSKFEALESVETGLKDSREGLVTAAESVTEASRSISELAKESREILGSFKEIAEILKKADTGRLVEEVKTLGSQVKKSGASIEQFHKEYQETDAKTREEISSSISAVAIRQNQLQAEINKEVQALKDYHEKTTLPLIRSMKSVMIVVGFFAIVAAVGGFSLGYFVR